MIKLALSFLLGVLLFQTSREFPTLLYLIYFPILVLAWLKYPQAIYILFLFFGYVWTHLFAYYLYYPQLSAELSNQDIVLKGVVNEVKTQTNQYNKFTFSIDKDLDYSLSKKIPDKVLLSWYQLPEQLHQNLTCELTVRLKKIWGFSNPGSHDYEKSLFLEGISARGYVREGKCSTILKNKLLEFSKRDQWIDRFLLESSSYDNSSLMQALTFAYRENISAKHWEVLRKTGTAHLIAISGLHLSSIAFVVFFFIKRLCCLNATLCNYIPAQSVAAIAAMVATLFYAYLAGFTLPTQRALMMVFLALLAILLRKPVFNISVYSSALLIVLLVNPLVVLSPAFWMSFLAVLFIFVAIKATQTLNKFMRIIYVQLYLGIALFPVSLLYFSEASVIAPLVNLIAIPYVSFIVLPMLLITQCVFLLGVNNVSWLLKLVDILLEWLWMGLEFTAEFKFASISYTPTLLGVMCFELGLFLLVQAKGLNVKHLAWILFSAVFFLKEPPVRSGQLRVTALDVGQGLSVLVETKNYTLLYDAGMLSPSGFNTGRTVVKPYLDWRGIRKVDLAVVSHNDSDHAGGMHWLLDNVVIEKLLVSNQRYLYSSENIALCREGEQWVWDEVLFEVLHPPNKWQSNDNNRSCVLQISHPAGTILLTGDIEKSTEERLIERYGDKLASDLITAPHHGSKSSSSYRFVDRVHPQTVVFSAGYMNRYGFPHATINQRYEAFGTHTVETAYQGAVTFLFERNLGIQMQTGHRLKNKRYWHSTEEALTDPIE